MDSEGELLNKLHCWATQEMHFYSQKSQQRLPTPEDFSALCRGPSAAIWKWVVANVQSTETLKTVKGNIALKNKSLAPSYKVKYDGDGGGEHYEATKHALLERRAALTREITSTLRDIGHIEQEVERLTTDIANTDHSYQQEKEGLANVRRKTALVHAFSQKCAHTAAQYGEYISCINTKTNNIKLRAQKALETEEYYSREVNHEGGEDSDDSQSHEPVLEAASVKNVRECCEEIGEFLSQTLKGAFAGDKSEFGRHKEPLWQRVDEVCANFSPRQILTSLLTHCTNTTAALRNSTSLVDIRRDAQKLKFKYENGEVKDLARPPSLVQSVHQLLQERSSEHFMRHMQCLQYTNEARNLEQSVAMVKGHIEKRLQKLFSQKTVDLKIARNLVDAEIDLAGQRACLHCLTAASDGYRETVEQSRQQRHELFDKYQRIQGFQEITDKKQAVIQVLVKQNINSRSRLDEQVAEIYDYLQRTSLTRQSGIQDTAGSLTGSVTAEIEQFANLALPYLLFSQIDNALKTAVLDLSIHQTSPAYIRPALQSVLNTLKFPTFQSPDRILHQCIRLREEIECALHTMETTHMAHTQHRQTDDHSDIHTVLTELCERMQASDADQISRMLPLLQQRINKTATALTHCIGAKDAVKHWWDQPGQLCVPWVKVDDHNLQYYLDRWTVLVTNLRQMLVK